MTRLLRDLGALLLLLFGAIAGAILAPIAVYALMAILGVAQSLCWGPTDSAADSCLVGTLAGLYVFMFLSWIPGAFVGFLLALRWVRARRRGR